MGLGVINSSFRAALSDGIALPALPLVARSPLAHSHPLNIRRCNSHGMDLGVEPRTAGSVRFYGSGFWLPRLPTSSTYTLAACVYQFRQSIPSKLHPDRPCIWPVWRVHRLPGHRLQTDFQVFRSSTSLIVGRATPYFLASALIPNSRDPLIKLARISSTWLIVSFAKSLLSPSARRPRSSISLIF